MKFLIVCILIKLGYNVNAYWRNPYQLNGVRGRSTLKCNPQKLHIPNPADPHSFYKCGADGKPVLFKCPPGTRFDLKLEVCNWNNLIESNGSNEGTNDNSGGIWSNPGADSSGGIWTTPGTSDSGSTWTTPGTSDSGSTLTTPIPVVINDNNTQQNGGIDCTKETSNNGPAKLYQNTDDCSAYYTCNMGRPVLTYCPRGLFFNPEINGCDDTTPEGCQLVDPDRQGGAAVSEETRKLRLRHRKNRIFG